MHPLDIQKLHHHFRRPTSEMVGRRSVAASDIFTISQETLFAESMRYRPGYLEAVLVAAEVTRRTDNDQELTIPAATLASLRRQFALGCCGQ